MDAGHDPLREDPLDDLSRAFRDWPAPYATRELTDEDQATRRSVAWLAVALQAQSPQTAAPPEALLQRASPAGPWRLLRAGRPLAAAAVLLALLGGPLLLLSEPAPSPAPPATVVDERTPPAPAAPDAGPVAGLVVAASRERIELRSGPVRLLLLSRDNTTPREEPR